MNALPHGFAPNFPQSPEHHIGSCVGSLDAWLRVGDRLGEFREYTCRLVAGRYLVTVRAGASELVFEDSSRQGALAQAVVGLGAE